LKDYYNLAFGDETIDGELDDTVVSDNGDGQKVLATVAATIYDFTNVNPNAYIFATGSSEARTRLYKIGISNNFQEIVQDFEVYGLLDEIWEDFELNRPYKAFLVKRK
jgi:hypothetical protein